MIKSFQGNNDNEIGNIEDNISTNDDYGFDKVLIVLSKQGKVYAMSSLTGRVQWMWFESRFSAEQIFVEQPSSKL